MAKQIDAFDFRPGRKIGPRYVIESKLGGGTEGEVFQIRELDTGIRRAAKIYYPHRDPKRRSATRHAQKLNKLRYCSIVLQYHHSEIITVKRQRCVAMISDLYAGTPLERWLHKHRRKCLTPYPALHVLYNLVRGLEAVHALGEYHADVHSQNILIQPRGVRYDLKLIDFYDWGRPAPFKQKQDIWDTIQVFFECLGGRTHYAKLPPEIKHILAGPRRDVMFKRFPTMTALRQHLETFEWKSTL
jgi:hypothetical protein